MRINWGWRIAIVYTLFAIGTLGVVALALSTEVDLVRDDYYQYSLQHDDVMKARARAHALVPAVSLEYDDASKAVTAKMPATFVGSMVQVDLYRASANHDDRSMNRVVDDRGEIVIPTVGLAAAPWRITLHWIHGGVAYEVERSLTTY